MEDKLKVGDFTNKGIVDFVYENGNISIDNELYNINKHNIQTMEDKLKTIEPTDKNMVWALLKVAELQQQKIKELEKEIKKSQKQKKQP